MGVTPLYYIHPAGIEATSLYTIILFVYLQLLSAVTAMLIGKIPQKLLKLFISNLDKFSLLEKAIYTTNAGNHQIIFIKSACAEGEILITI